MTVGRHFGLAFDFDGPSGDALVEKSIWQKPGFFALGAYGPNRAVPRILEVLEELEISATFFTPAWVVERWADLCRSIRDAGHEMAGHGDRHEKFFGKDPEAQNQVLERSQEVFTRLLGAPANGFRAPAGDVDSRTLNLLSQNGYTYSSSFRSGDAPFRHEGSAIAELPAKSIFDDYAAFAYHRAPNFPAGLDRIADYCAVFRSWNEEAEAGADEELPVVSIWHPKVIGTPGRLHLMEEFLRSLKNDRNIHIGRCDLIVEKWLGVNGQ